MQSAYVSILAYSGEGTKKISECGDAESVCGECLESAPPTQQATPLYIY
jgi:hypothetical protein